MRRISSDSESGVPENALKMKKSVIFPEFANFIFTLIHDGIFKIPIEKQIRIFFFLAVTAISDFAIVFEVAREIPE